MTQTHRLLLKWARIVHVYLTMFGFVLLFFFAVTGFMLNHEDWFLARETTTGKMPIELLGTPENRDGIIEKLRDEFGVPPGEVESFDLVAATNSFRVTFKTKHGPWEALIQREGGATEVTNHTDLQSRERINIVEGTMPLELLAPDDPSKQLPIVERLRKDFAARGEVNVPPTYEKETESIAVVFKAPSHETKATIRVSDGYTRVTHRTRGINGVLLDLHRGKDSGLPWSVIIDGVSVVFVIVSITGLILWSSLRGRAQHGFAILMLGLAVGLVVYFVYVPR